MKKPIVLIAMFFLLCLPSFVLANDATEDSARAFFEKYITLNENFDSTVASLYSEDAIFKTVRVYPNGQTKEMNLSASKLKYIIKVSMPLAKKKGDISKYTDITITVKGPTATIKAFRYSALKCYTDKEYYMIIQRDTKGAYLIIEEYTQTQPQSDC